MVYLNQQTNSYYHQPLVVEKEIWDNLYVGSRSQSSDANTLNIQSDTYIQLKKKSSLCAKIDACKCHVPSTET